MAKKTVNLMGLNEVVIFDESKTFEYTTSSGEVCETAAVTEDGRLIAWDEGCNSWVQIAQSAEDALSE